MAKWGKDSGKAERDFHRQHAPDPEMTDKGMGKLMRDGDKADNSPQNKGKGH